MKTKCWLLCIALVYVYCFDFFFKHIKKGKHISEEVEEEKRKEK